LRIFDLLYFAIFSETKEDKIVKNVGVKEGGCLLGKVA